MWGAVQNNAVIGRISPHRRPELVDGGNGAVETRWHRHDPLRGYAMVQLSAAAQEVKIDTEHGAPLQTSAILLQSPIAPTCRAEW